MYIANSETAAAYDGILDYMPKEIRRYMYGINFDGACEIRMSLGKPLSIHYRDGCFYLGAKTQLTKLPSSAIKVTREHIDEAIEIAAASSVYSVSDEIKNGFITIKGGHRIGITGSAVVKDGKISFIKDISSLNYRLASEVIGAADKVMPLIENSGRIKNTLIISPPGAGKTTMLRDITRQLSYRNYRVSVVDERHEIAAMYEGVSAFDLGFFTDVIEGADKSCGMLMVLRSMNPDVIVTDEIGTRQDIEAIERVTNSGAAVIASIHGRDIDMIKKRSDLCGMLKFFDLVITLGKEKGAGRVKEALSEW